MRIKYFWELCLSWYLAGAICGLTIAQLLITDEALSLLIMMISMGFLIVNLCILLFVIMRSKNDN